MSIQANINLLHFPSALSVSGGGRRTPTESGFSGIALDLTTTPEVIPKGDIITPRYVAVKNYEGDDVLVSIDGGSTWPFRLSSDNDVTLLRLNFEDNREISTFVTGADTAGSLSGDKIVLFDRTSTVWPWFNITNPTSVKEVSTVETIADVADSLDGDYFLIYDNVGSVEVWINTSGGGATAPGIGARAIAVPVTTGATAAQVATAIQTAVDADSKFVATVVDDLVTITDANYGARTNIAAGTSGFTVGVATEGVSGINPSIAPTVTTERLIQVNIASGSTALQVAVALAAAIDADAEFNAPVPTTSTVVITDQHAGARGSATEGTTGWAAPTVGNQGADFYDVEIKSAGTSKAVTAVCPN